MANLASKNNFVYPSGTTASRPTSVNNGFIYFNTTVGALQIYQNGSWYVLTNINAPGAPTSVSATDQGTGRAYNNGQASISFTPATETYGFPATYTVTSTPGSYTATGTSSPILITGLQSSTQYTYVVNAANNTGSTNSSASSGVTATTVPQAPTIGTATAGTGTATLTFTAGATGGSAITNYKYSTDGSTYTAFSPAQTTSPLSFSGLTNGNSYAWYLKAVNENGDSAASSISNSVTPISTTYFIAAQSLSGNTIYGAQKSIDIDSSGNVYTNHHSVYSGRGTGHLSKFNSSGSLVWGQADYIGSIGSTYDYGAGLGIDSSDNVYFGIDYDYSTQTIGIGKMNTSGSIAWSTGLRSYGGSNSYTRGSNVDSLGNRYSCILTDYNGTNFTTVLAKHNSSGTLQWQRKLTGSSWYEYRDAVTDSSGNIYVVGRTNQSGTYYTIIVKYNSGGTLQWQRTITDSNSLDGNGIDIDSSNNLYIVCSGTYAGSSIGYIIKLDSSGSTIWQRKISSNTVFWKVSVDSDGNSFIAGSTNSSQAGVIVKYNSSGVLQWQRTVTNSNTAFYSVKAKNNNIYLAGESGSGHVTLKIPNDGSKTGTYTANGQTFVYAASSLAENSAATSNSSIIMSEGSGNMTVQNVTFSTSSTNLSTGTTTL